EEAAHTTHSSLRHILRPSPPVARQPSLVPAVMDASVWQGDHAAGNPDVKHRRLGIFQELPGRRAKLINAAPKPPLPPTQEKKNVSFLLSPTAILYSPCSSNSFGFKESKVNAGAIVL